MNTPGPVDAALIALLSDPVTAKLSDDELARRAGVHEIPLSGGETYVQAFRLEFADAKRYLENDAKRNQADAKCNTSDDVWRVMGLAYIFRKDPAEYSESDLKEITAYYQRWRANENAARVALGKPPLKTAKPPAKVAKRKAAKPPTDLEDLFDEL